MQIHYSKHHNVSWTLDLPKRHCLHVTLPSCDVCMHWHVIIYMCAAATWSSTLVLLCLIYKVCCGDQDLLSDALDLATLQTYVTNANNIIAKYDDLKQLDLVALNHAVGTDKLPKDAATGLRCPFC